MQRIDILSSITKAYQASWNARAYLVKLAFVPLLLKFICFTLATSYAGGADDSYLRFMLIMLPALLAEGWMLAHCVRYLVLNQTWPFQPTGDMDRDMAVLTTRARGVLSGMIVFVLIHMALGVMVYAVQIYMIPYLPKPDATDIPEIPLYVGVLSLLMLMAMFWGFRLLWLYIPYSLNMNALAYLKISRGARLTLALIALWLLCLLPFVLVLNLAASLVSALLGGALGASITSFVLVFLTVATDTAKSLVTTAGITFALRDLYAGHKTEAA